MTWGLGSGVWGLGSLGPGRLVVSVIGQLGYLPHSQLGCFFPNPHAPLTEIYASLRIGTSLEIKLI